MQQTLIDEILIDEALTYLDEVREAGVYQAVDLLLSLEAMFLLQEWEAQIILMEWVRGYGIREYCA